jgi:D-alanine-D-alanine ligase
MNITVLKGGISAERDVSLKSGAAVAAALRGAGHAVTEVDVTAERFDLPPCDIAFLALHGTFGEDGGVQLLLTQLGIPFTGCGAASSAVAFDKNLSKAKFVEAGVPTPGHQILLPGDTLTLPLPVVAKPPRQGSSVGITRVMTEADLAPAVELARQFQPDVLMEQFVTGQELTVGILGDTALPVVHIEPKDGFYDYQNKYTPGRTEYHCPADLDEATTRRVQEAALAAHRALGCEVYSRVDVLLDAEGRPWVLEVNTIPGMTETSLLPKSAAAVGLGFAALCERIMELSLAVPGSRGTST